MQSRVGGLNTLFDRFLQLLDEPDPVKHNEEGEYYICRVCGSVVKSEPSLKDWDKSVWTCTNVHCRFHTEKVSIDIDMYPPSVERRFN